MQCEREMMAIDHKGTSVGAQNDRDTVRVEIVGGLAAGALSPMPAFDIDLAHPHRHLRGSKVRYWDSLVVFPAGNAHGEDHKLDQDSDEAALL